MRLLFSCVRLCWELAAVMFYTRQFFDVCGNDIYTSPGRAGGRMLVAGLPTFVPPYRLKMLDRYNKRSPHASSTEWSIV
jgi:hypothetical protein